MNDPQDRLVDSVVNSLPRSEKIVNHNVDLKDWKITTLYKDTLWVKLLDEPDATTVKKNGIVMAVSQAKGVYSLGEVLMSGPDVKHASTGQRIMFIKQAGQPAHRNVDGYKTWFVREDAVLAVVEYDGTDEQMKEDIKNQILLG